MIKFNYNLEIKEISAHQTVQLIFLEFSLKFKKKTCSLEQSHNKIGCIVIVIFANFFQYF